MTHPFEAHRQHKVEKSRVGHITKGYATGGAVSGSPSAGSGVTTSASVARKHGGKIKGAKSSARLDRYARGGKVKGKGHTSVNVVVAPQGGDKPAIPAMPPQGAMPPPRPPMPPMAGPGAPMMPPGGPGSPPGVIRRSGGRAYASGGKVTAAYKEGLRNGTQVQHSDGKNDGSDIYRAKQITYAKGGKVRGIDDGAGGGEGRLEKIALQKRSKRP